MQRDVRTLPVASPGCQDRRIAWRYPLQLELHYRLRKKDRLLSEGFGKTVNISSKGVLLALSGQTCPKGASAELAIPWPVDRHPSFRRWLSVFGEVLRTDAQGVAVRIVRYDFSSPSQKMRANNPERRLAFQRRDAAMQSGSPQPQ